MIKKKQILVADPFVDQSMQIHRNADKIPWTCQCLCEDLKKAKAVHNMLLQYFK